VGATNGAWIVRPGQPPVHVRAASAVDGWSSDGRVLAATEYVRATNSYRELALSPDGRVLWSVRNVQAGEAAWSVRGLLAVVTGGNAAGARQAIGVYDEDGSRVALASKRALQVRTATGRVLLRKRLRHDFWWNHVGWNGDGRVVLAGYGSCQCREISVDVRTGKMSQALHRWAAQTSPDGKLAILRTPSGDGFEIRLARTAGGHPDLFAYAALRRGSVRVRTEKPLASIHERLLDAAARPLLGVGGRQRRAPDHETRVGSWAAGSLEGRRQDRLLPGKRCTF
jgi:hypothetical protein